MKYNALAYARDAHEGQMYGELAYTHHVQQVEMLATAIAYDYGLRESDIEVVKQIALLHDIVEDTDKTIECIKYKFGGIVAVSVGLLTKMSDLSYAENSQRLIESGDIYAMIVKLADNKANFGSDKSHMNRSQAKSMRERYSKNMEKLKTALDKHFEV